MLGLTFYWLIICSMYPKLHPLGLRLFSRSSSFSWRLAHVCSWVTISSFPTSIISEIQQSSLILPSFCLLPCKLAVFSADITLSKSLMVPLCMSWRLTSVPHFAEIAKWIHKTHRLLSVKDCPCIPMDFSPEYTFLTVNLLALASIAIFSSVPFWFLFSQYFFPSSVTFLLHFTINRNEKPDHTFNTLFEKLSSAKHSNSLLESSAFYPIVGHNSAKFYY